MMKYGSASKEVDESHVWLGVCQSLQVAHQAGIFHCDIRKSNVLYFDAIGWRLVDFGLSCEVAHDKYELDLDSGAQANGVGPRVKGCLQNGLAIRWNAGDDYEMTMKMFGVL